MRRIHASAPSLALGAGLVATLAAATPLAAQERLLARGAASIAPSFESWSLTDALPHGSGGVNLTGVSQFTMPVAMSTTLGERWAADLAAAYAHGSVTLDREDAQLGTSTLTLAGLTDVRVRATGRFLGERLLLTLGANLPTGTTELDAEQLTALRALSAPAFGLRTPLLGAGGGATVGLVYARPVGGAWALAVGSSYEYRASYTPAAVTAGIATPDFSPAGAAHFSLGLDGLLGRHGATITTSLDLFGEDRLQFDGSDATGPTTRLGPVATVDARLRLAATGFRELTLYATDRWRSSFERAGEKVPESAGNYLDAGADAVWALSPSTGLVTGLNLRHHTGLKFDDGVQTAAVAAGALTVGLSRSLAGGVELLPFVRGQLGRMESGNASSGVRGMSAGVSLSRRF